MEKMLRAVCQVSTSTVRPSVTKLNTRGREDYQLRSPQHTTFCARVLCKRARKGIWQLYRPDNPHKASAASIMSSSRPTTTALATAFPFPIALVFPKTPRRLPSRLPWLLCGVIAS